MELLVLVSAWWDWIAVQALKVFTVEQWQSLLIMLACIVGVTENVKRIFLSKLQIAKKRIYVRATAAVLAIIGSIIGYMIAPTIPAWFWLFTACTGGIVSAAVQMLVIAVVRWKLPGLANAMEGKRAVI